MSSEEMRMELESFVNAGLREGWRGWPLKDEEAPKPDTSYLGTQTRMGRTLGDRLGLAPLRVWCCCRSSSTVSMGRQGVFAVSPLLS